MYSWMSRAGIGRSPIVVRASMARALTTPDTLVAPCSIALNTPRRAVSQNVRSRALNVSSSSAFSPPAVVSSLLHCRLGSNRLPGWANATIWFFPTSGALPAWLARTEQYAVYWLGPSDNTVVVTYWAPPRVLSAVPIGTDPAPAVMLARYTRSCPSATLAPLRVC